MQVSADRQTAPEVEIPHMQACASGKGAGNQQTCRGDAPSPPDTPKALPEGRLRIDDVFGFREKLGHGQYGLVSRAVGKNQSAHVMSYVRFDMLIWFQCGNDNDALFSLDA